MRIFLKTTIRVAILLIIVAFLFSKRNHYCIDKETCRPIYLASDFAKLKKLFSKAKSNQSSIGSGIVSVNFKTISSDAMIEIAAEKKQLNVAFGKVEILKLTFVNHGNEEVAIKPFFSTEPRYVESFVKLHQCICNLKIRLKPEEKKVVKIVFEIDSELAKEKISEVNFVYGL